MTCGNAPVSITLRASSSLRQGKVADGEMEAEVVGHALHVHVADHQTAPRGRIDDAEKAERLGRLAGADAADAEAIGEFLLGGQTISRPEAIVDDVLLDAFRDHFAQVLAFDYIRHGFNLFVRRKRLLQNNIIIYRPKGQAFGSVFMAQ